MPLLSLGHALKKASKDCRVVYIGLKDEALAETLKARFRIFDAVYYVPAGKFRRYHGESLLAHLTDLRTLALNARDFFRVLAGIGYAKKYLKQINPDVVLSKGGFVAVPVGVAAKLLKIPIVTHDSDTVPGLANRIVGRFAAVRATGMPASYYKHHKGSIHYFGIPLDERIKPVNQAMQVNFKKGLKIPTDSLVLLIGGSGLGARDVNNKVLAVAADILKLFPRLYIVHAAGQKHQEQVEKSYRTIGVDSKRVKVLGFTPDFYKYSGAADLIVSRAGATTIAELAAQKKAVILIPAAHLTGGHQLKNATELAKNQAVLVVDNDSPADELLAVVSQILEDEPARRKLADNLGALAKPDAADKLAELLLKVAHRQIKQ
ncbi:MAG TPA: glycosyltransferase [Candidatus Saccharimonadales bacterium]